VLILAFDSSTGVVTAGVARSGEGGREVLAETSIPSRGASETLLPAVHAALDLAGTNLNAVERILVGVGPGTRCLSLVTGAALSKNSTLAALAAPALLGAAEPEILAVLDARRRQVFAQRFGAGGARGEISCTAPEELPATPVAESAPAGEPTLLVGDGAVRYREALSGLGRIPPGASPLHRVTAVGHVLSAELTPVPAREVVPLYIREPDAEARRDLNPWSKA
jgi:tRNA threonylcarbamoyladenosine biosynthesis protein TsaB